jgi:hypothetical protein
MKPPEDSRMADEKAAIGLQRKKPSWRATAAIYRDHTKQLLPSIEHSLWGVVGLIVVIFVIGWLLGVR